MRPVISVVLLAFKPDHSFLPVLMQKGLRDSNPWAPVPARCRGRLWCQRRGGGQVVREW